MSKLSVDDIVTKINDKWDELLRDGSSGRTVTYGTGRSGAINAEVMMIKMFSPDRSEEDIRKEVEAKVWEDGQYEIGGDQYIRYCGLHDREHSDGFFGIVRHGRNYLEHWQGGSRIQYKIVDDEEFNKLKAESNEHTKMAED